MNSIFTNRFGFPTYRLIEFDNYTVVSNNAKLEANNITFWLWNLFCFLLVLSSFLCGFAVIRQSLYFCLVGVFICPTFVCMPGSKLGHGLSLWFPL